MKNLKRPVFYICLFFSFLSLVAEAKDWRGLTPARSTRQEVERLLGQPATSDSSGKNTFHPHRGRYFYFLEDVEVYIIFGGDQPFQCPGKIHEDTVVFIQITPNKKLPLASLNLNLSRYEKFNPERNSFPGFEGYASEEEGFVIGVANGDVYKLCYLATA
jgi:hypothetical protein